MPQEEIDPQPVAPEDYALVVELLDSENGEELKEKDYARVPGTAS